MDGMLCPSMRGLHRPGQRARGGGTPRVLPAPRTLLRRRRVRHGRRTFRIVRVHQPIVHTVEVEHLHLAQFGLAGPTLALKVQGACHTLSATSLSEVALRRTCTESIRKKSTLKTALTKKKTKFALSTLGVIYFLIYLPNYRKKLLQRRPRQPLLPHPIMMLRSLRMMS